MKYCLTKRQRKQQIPVNTNSIYHTDLHYVSISVKIESLRLVCSRNYLKLSKMCLYLHMY